MPRVKRGTHHAKRRRNILRSAKGYKWGRKSKLKLAKIAVIRAGAHAWRDRRVKKRLARAAWQIKINAGARAAGTTYSRLANAFAKKQIGLDRKVLADLAEHEPKIFASLVKTAMA